jgi:hypothetical protein
VIGICVACVLALVALLVLPPVNDFVEDQGGVLKKAVLGVTLLVPVAFFGWYMLTYVEVRRGVLRVSTMLNGPTLDLRRLARVEVHSRTSSRSKRRRFELILHMEDDDGSELWLPLNSWRDEDLVMARLLRATVDRKVRIEGDPMLVRRFSGLLDTYKSWDRQQAAA